MKWTGRGQVIDCMQISTKPSPPRPRIRSESWALETKPRIQIIIPVFEEDLGRGVGRAERSQRSRRRLGINPAEYLQDLFERLPKAKTSEIKSLTPAVRLKAKQAAARQSA
jgi:hypothetical protein